MPHSLPTTLCFAPFIQITTHPSGSFSPCPYLGGTTWLEHTGTIMEKWTGKELEGLRKGFLEGEQPSICRRCWQEESIGKKSLRKRLYDLETNTTEYEMFLDHDTVKSVLDSIESKDYLKGPRIISIKNGNVCNAKCRSCHPEDSSQWIQDANKLHEKTNKKFYKVGMRESNWSDDQIDQLREMANNLYRIELFGGESLYNKKVIRLLNQIIDDGNSEHIGLYINTNGSVDILEKIPKISKFRDLDIGVSIDAIPEHFSYVRHPLEFDVVADNVRRWREHFTATKTKHMIQSVSTVSILNIYYLTELKQTVIDLLGHPPFWNLLVHPKHLSIVNLPDPVKEQVIARIGSDPDFQEFVTFMNRFKMDIDHFSTFFNIRDELDLIRRENFRETFGEWADIIEAHRPPERGVRVFVGDLSDAWAGQYLESVAREVDDQSFLLIEGDRPDTVCIVEPDDWRRTVPIDELPFGYYYTGVTKWQDMDKLLYLLKTCKQVFYAPPHTWSDKPKIGDPNAKPYMWSKRVLEDLLKQVNDVKIIPLKPQQGLQQPKKPMVLYSQVDQN